MPKIIKKLHRALATLQPYKTKYCCLCNKKVATWLPYQGGWKKASPLMRALDIIGSDLDNFSCPSCGSHDRERHLFLYLEALNLFSKMKSTHILHFAPETHLSKQISIKQPKQYIKADLYPTSEDIQKIDLLNITYKDDTFDFIIANHVLEHVPDYHLALKEIYRVLKPEGLAILQTPYSNIIQKTWEDAGITTDMQRLEAYGQEDHVRLFGKDIFKQIESENFISQIKEHSEVLSDKSTDIYGINADEPLMMFSKNNS